MSKVQSVLFDKNVFNPETAVIWLAKHGFKFKKIDITDNYIRFRQFEPSKNAQYITKKITKGVEFIIQF